MKNNKKKNLLLSLILAAICIAFLLYVDKFQHYSMLATVLKKGAIYSLVAVSLNLLNGFTGLFSLGQAGFMMIGAYTYGILTIPVTDRLNVYQYFDGGIVQFCLPMLVGLILAGIVRHLRLAHRSAGAEAEERLSGHCHSGLCRDHARHHPVETAWAPSPTPPTCCASFAGFDAISVAVRGGYP